MRLTNWLQAVVEHFQAKPACRDHRIQPFQLGLERMEDRRVLSVSGAEVMLFSVGTDDVNVPNLPGVTAADIVSYDASQAVGNQFGIFFDGSDVNLTNANIDALAVLSDNQLLFSFASTTMVEGVGMVQSSDIILFEATSLGENTAGTFSMFLKGSVLELYHPQGNIDALDILEDGTLIFSIEGKVDLPVGENGNDIPVEDEVLIQITPDENGAYTAASMQIFFDGSQASLGVSTEDIDGVSVVGSTLRLSTDGSFNIEAQGIGGSKDDVLQLDLNAFREGATDFYLGVTFDGSMVFGKTFDLNALDFITISESTNNPPTAGNSAGTLAEDGFLSVQLVGDDGDADVEQSLTYQIVEGPNFGTISGFDSATGTFIYTPNADYHGTDQILFVVQETDENGNLITSEVAMVALTVTPVNDAPVVLVQQPQLVGNEDQPVVIQGLSVDDVEASAQNTVVSVTLHTDAGKLSLENTSTAVAVAGDGTETIVLTGTILEINQLLFEGVTFQPGTNFSGNATINITIQDDVNPDHALTSTQSVAVEILSVNDQVRAFQQRISELVDNGDLGKLAGRKLLNAVTPHGNAPRIQQALNKIDRWERLGRLDAELAQELKDSLESIAKGNSIGKPHHHGHPKSIDALFAHFGKVIKHFRRFRC